MPRSVSMRRVFSSMAWKFSLNVVVLDRGAGEVQGFGHAEHALFEDVVEPGGRVGGLDLVQESTGGLAQAHCAPDVCVERYGAGECEAVGVGGFELAWRERGVTVLVHAPRVEGLDPGDVPWRRTSPRPSPGVR